MTPASEQSRSARKLLPAAALLLACLAGVFASHQHQGAVELMKQLRSLKSAVQEKNDALQKQAALIEELREQNDAYIKESALLREKQSTAAAPLQKTEAPAPPSTAENNQVEFAAKTYEDPRVKEVMRQKQIAQVKQVYADFIKENRVTPEQAEKFLALEVADVLQQIDADDRFFNGEEDDGIKPWPERKAELGRQLKEMLGEAGFAKYEAYEKTTGDRDLLIHIREQLGLNSTPLRGEQANTLLRIMLEERARTPATAFNPSGPQSSREKYQVAIEGDNAEQYFKAQTDFNQRVLSRSGTLLSPDQYEALETFQTQYLTVSKFGVQMAREILTRKNK